MYVPMQCMQDAANTVNTVLDLVSLAKSPQLCLSNLAATKIDHV